MEPFFVHLSGAVGEEYLEVKYTSIGSSLFLSVTLAHLVSDHMSRGR